MHDPLESTTLSHYRIHRRLGGGGMGVVYRAEDLRLERPVAIKLLPSQWSDDEVAKIRFIREARAASAIEHPNICAIHEVDQTADGRLFIVMPFYPGESLKKKIERGPLPLVKAVDYFEQVMRGLQKAHQQGIVHRDIKPANLMVTTEDAVKIVDFGLAKLAGDRQLTQVGQTLGTVEYMSPEQTRAEELDARSDLWSAGVVLFEMLTGRKPFRGAPSVAIEAIRSGETPSVSDLRAGVPERLQGVLERLLNKNAEQRFQSATQVLEALEASPATSLTSAPTLAYGHPPAVRRARSTRVVAAAFGLLLLVVGLIVWRSERSQRGPPPRPQLSRMRIAVLAPEATGLRDDKADWPRLIQTFLAAQLTGTEEFGVIDPLTLNGLIESDFGTVQPARGPSFYDLLDRSGVDLVVDGSLFEQDRGLRLVANLIQPGSGETLLSRTVTSGGDEDLLEVMGRLSEKLVEYLQIEALGKKRGDDLAPWVSPRKHKVEALRAFMQATEYIFRYEQGGGRYLSRALEIDPDFITARVWLVSGLVVAGERDEAAKHLEVLRSQERSATRFEQTMIAWAGAFFEADLEEQARHLGIALGYTPENYILLANLGFVRHAMGDCEATLEALERPVGAGWGYPPIYPIYGGCLVRKGQFQEARRVLLEALTIQPVHPGVYGMLQALSIHAGDDDNAELYAGRAAIEVPPAEIEQVGEVFFLTGSDALRSGNSERAAQLLGEAVGHQPDSAPFREALGEALYRSGASAEAREAFRAAVRLDGGRALAVLRLGRIAEESDEPDRAATHYRSYLSLQPTGPQAEDVRQRLRRLETTAHRK